MRAIVHAVLVVQVLLALRQQFGNADDARVVIEYIKDCEMGFELVGVTVTTQRALSLIASVVIGAVFAFGSAIADSVSSGAPPATCSGIDLNSTVLRVALQRGAAPGA